MRWHVDDSNWFALFKLCGGEIDEINSIERNRKREKLTVVFDDLDFRRTEIILIAKPSRVLIGIVNNGARVAVDFNASNVLGGVGNLPEKNRCKVKRTEKVSLKKLSILTSRNSPTYCAD